MQYYDPFLCPRCLQPIENINEVHLNLNLDNVYCKGRIFKGAFVYLMHDLTADLLKIGFSDNPFRRHYQIVHGSTNEIKLLAYYPGSTVNEKIVHRKFKSANVKREYFRNDSEIIEYFLGHPLVILPPT